MLLDYDNTAINAFSVKDLYIIFTKDVLKERIHYFFKFLIQEKYYYKYFFKIRDERCCLT